jgi:hypothetical protein
MEGNAAENSKGSGSLGARLTAFSTGASCT